MIEACKYRALICLEIDSYMESLKRTNEIIHPQDILQAALDAADAGTFSYDIVNDTLLWDKKSFELFSVNSESFANNYIAWMELVLAEDQARTEKKFKQILKGTQSRFQFEYRVQTNSKMPRWLNVKAQISRNNQGEAIWIDGLHLDITPTKELENKLLQSEARFRSLVENSPDWVWETDEHGCYLYSSPHAKDILGYSSDEIKGKTLFILMDGDERERLLPIYQQLIHEQLAFSDVEHTCLHKDGSKISIITNASPIYDINGKFTGYQGIHRNITEQLAVKKLKVEKEIAELANQSKSEFLANMSHELRTPMHAILSFSKLGVNKINLASPEKLLSYFEKINQSGSRLLALLNDLLDLSKLEAGMLEFNFTQNNLVAILNQCIAEQEAQLNIKHLTINIIDSKYNAEAEFDAVKIGQVVTNFLSNAIKFSEFGGALSVVIKNDDLFSDLGMIQGLSLSLTDEGIGIPYNELDTIFDKFVQSSKTKTGAGGTGLGLAICKEFIDAHGGRIWAEHNLPEGSVFSFVIPLKQGQAQ